MTDYTELVEALRCKSLSKKCDSCDYGYHLSPDSECNDACHVEQIYADAADAIERITAMYEKAEIDATNLTGKLAQAEAEVERLKDSNEELREKQTFIDHYGTEWMTSAKDVPTAAYEHGYADGKAEERAKMQKRNAELHAELEKWVSAAEKAGEPKRGEFVYVRGDGGTCCDGWECSVCGKTYHTNVPYFGEYKYCPNCGAKMNGEQNVE